jgi:hypothetical protein
MTRLNINQSVYTNENQVQILKKSEQQAKKQLLQILIDVNKK